MIEDQKICGNCKWINQGQHSSHCINPKQTNQVLTGHVYWNFDCPLFEKGAKPSEEEMKALGYTYFSEKENQWAYWKKTA